jgi:hypothetical protein
LWHGRPAEGLIEKWAIIPRRLDRKWKPGEECVASRSKEGGERAKVRIAFRQNQTRSNEFSLQNTFSDSIAGCSNGSRLRKMETDDQLRIAIK